MKMTTNDGDIIEVETSDESLKEYGIKYLGFGKHVNGKEVIVMGATKDWSKKLCFRFKGDPGICCMDPASLKNTIKIEYQADLTICSTILKAVSNNEEEKVKKLFEALKTIEEMGGSTYVYHYLQYPSGNSLLHEAAEKKFKNIIQCLLKNYNFKGDEKFLSLCLSNKLYDEFIYYLTKFRTIPYYGATSANNILSFADQIDEFIQNYDVSSSINSNPNLPFEFDECCFVLDSFFVLKASEYKIDILSLNKLKSNHLNFLIKTTQIFITIAHYEIASKYFYLTERLLKENTKLQNAGYAWFELGNMKQTLFENLPIQMELQEANQIDREKTLKEHRINSALPYFQNALNAGFKDAQTIILQLEADKAGKGLQAQPISTQSNDINNNAIVPSSTSSLSSFSENLSSAQLMKNFSQRNTVNPNKNEREDNTEQPDPKRQRQDDQYQFS